MLTSREGGGKENEQRPMARRLGVSNIDLERGRWSGE
jgi:hypothetical protein